MTIEDKHNVIEPLHPFLVPIDSINPDPANARKHGDRNMATIIASLTEHGQRQPLVVQKEGMIIRSGNGRWMAAKQLGWTHVAALVIDESTLAATRYAIVDNKSAELAEWDFPTLAGLLDGLKTDGSDLQSLGFADHELDVLLTATWTPDPVNPEVKSGHDEKDRIAVFFSAEQFGIVERAVAAIRNKCGDDELGLGRCLELVCADFLGAQ